MAPWWLRASDDEQLADSPAELAAFKDEDEPIVTLAEPGGAPPAVAFAPAASPAAQDDDEEPEGLDDEGDLAAEGEDADAKSGSVRRRRRRRRGRRGEGAAAPAPAAAPEHSVPAPVAPAPVAPAPAPAAAPPRFVFPAPPDEPASAAPLAAPPAPVPVAEPAPPERPIFVPPVHQLEPPPAPKPAPRAEAHDHGRPSSRLKPGRHAEREAPAGPAPFVPEPRPARIELPYNPPEIPAMPMESLPKTAFVYTMPERPSSPADERKIAMFVDFENIALGVRDSEVRTFDMTLILERLLEKGKIIVKKAYADWERYSEFKRPFHEAAIELIDIPQKFYSGKNSADIKMVVDAMDLCYSKEHLDTFVLVSGDSDFSPLVSKLKENNKYVIGLGVKNSSSNLLIDNCDEFIYYEDVWRDTQRVPRLDHLGPKEAECFQVMCESIVALLRENKEVLWGSLVKQTMQRKRPSFSEGYYGYGTFTELLEDAERKNIIRLRRDQRSGTYIVVGFVPPRAKRG